MRQSACGARILCNETLKAEIERGARGRIDAHVRHHTDNDDALDLSTLEMIEQWRIAETIRIMFLKKRFVFERLDVFVCLDTVGIGQKKCCGWFRRNMLDVHEREIPLSKER